MAKRLEEKLSGKFIKGTGIFKGLKIPVEYRGQYVIFTKGNLITSNKSIRRAMQIYQRNKKNNNSVPCLLYAETKEESKAIHVYSVVA